MLLQFTVENFRSFHHETLLTMIPGKKDRIHLDHVISSEEKGRKAEALPLALLYGANASGKSNLVKALAFARRIIVDGTKSESQIPVESFRLAAEATGRPSRFEFVLKHDDVLYTYGFAATRQKIIEEWLFASFTARESLMFERTTDGNQARVDAGSRLASTKKGRQRIEFVAAGTRPNQLFLTEAAERNVTELQPIMKWFRNNLKIISPDQRYHPLPLRAQADERFSTFLSNFLKAADTGVDSVEVQERRLEADQPIGDVPDFFKKEMLENLDTSSADAVVFGAGQSMYSVKQLDDKSIQLLTLQTKHRMADGSEVLFDLKDESDGTNRLMDLAPALLRLERSEDVYVIDELDRSLHPNLCKAYIEAFLAGVSKRGCRGQMILTTHDAGLLDLELVRRDEIWFVEKDLQGNSQLRSLADYKIRSDLRIDKGYINGRFGAVPFLGDVADLLASEDCK